MSRSTAREYYRSLDGVRGVGIVFVLGYHFLLLSDYDWSTIGFSWIWIQMFFVQSGFLITRILLDDKNESAGQFFGRFYWRRILRIFPVYFGYLLIALVASTLFNVPEDFGSRAPTLFTFTYNFADIARKIVRANLWFIHFWSLSVEEQFYLVWPLFIFLLGIRSLRVLVVAVIVLAPLFRLWFVQHLMMDGITAEMSGRVSYSFTISQLDALATGAAIPILNLAQHVRRTGRWVAGMAFLLIAAGTLNFVMLHQQGVLISFTSLGLSGGMVDNFQHVWSYSLVNLLFLFLILHLTTGRYQGIFTLPIFVRLGKIVYGMYVIHMAVLIGFDWLNERYIHNIALSFAMGFGATFLLADLSYRHFERRFLALKDSWIGKAQRA
jgi:peptidoglycan/LPS O-acetylase OafA/YrhL